MITHSSKKNKKEISPCSYRQKAKRKEEEKGTSVQRMWLDFNKGWMASWPLKTSMYKWVEIIRLIKCHASSSQCMAWRDWEMPFCLCTDVLHWLGFAHFRGKLPSRGHPWWLAWASTLMETHKCFISSECRSFAAAWTLSGTWVKYDCIIQCCHWEMETLVKGCAADQGAEFHLIDLTHWWVCAVSAGLNSYNLYLVFLKGKESFIEVV